MPYVPKAREEGLIIELLDYELLVHDTHSHRSNALNATADAPGWWRPDPDVVTRRLGDEVVLIHLRTNQIYELNRTAARIWELISAGATRPQIEQWLEEEFDVPADRLPTTVDSFLAELADSDLVVVEEADDAAPARD